MKTFQQEGTSLRRIALSESDNICRCCDSVTHYQEAGGQMHDDAECPVCHALCSCKCHRDPTAVAEYEGITPPEPPLE